MIVIGEYLALPKLRMKKRREENVCINNNACRIQVEPY